MSKMTKENKDMPDERTEEQKDIAYGRWFRAEMEKKGYTIVETKDCEALKSQSIPISKVREISDYSESVCLSLDMMDESEMCHNIISISEKLQALISETVAGDNTSDKQGEG